VRERKGTGKRRVKEYGSKSENINRIKDGRSEKEKKVFVEEDEVMFLYRLYK
jgi:hypothetical protein